MRDATYIIKKPLVTEKATWEASHVIQQGKRQGQPLNRYTFQVAMTANKPQIRAAVQELYGVRVQKVSTQIRKGRTYRTRHGVSSTGDWKKATVQLQPDDKIELF